jgi:glycosyltransferase involved in cell wall biosynthesis
LFLGRDHTKLDRYTELGRQYGIPGVRLEEGVRILWFCNCSLSELDAGGTGTWLGSMARGLLDSESIELGILAPGPVKEFTRQDFHQAQQWLVPAPPRLGGDGLPSRGLVKSILEVAEAFSPDLVHIWGTESFWGLLTARGLLRYPALLEMQGLKGQIAKVYLGGLTLSERWGCLGPKEILKRRTMFADRRDFSRWRVREEEMIRGHRFVDVQSLWVEAQVRAANRTVRTFSTDLALRQPFYGTKAWRPALRSNVFCSVAYTSAFKGLHVAVRALHLLQGRLPEARLRIAGVHPRSGLRQDGYTRWLDRQIRDLDLEDSVDWLGSLNAEQIVQELQGAAVAVIPSFMENCCTSMQEAMAVGTPVVASQAGGMPSLGQDGHSCLFFPPGDEALCAYQMERVMTDGDLALRLSWASRSLAEVRNDRQRIVQRQLEIYEQVLAADKGQGEPPGC